MLGWGRVGRDVQGDCVVGCRLLVSCVLVLVEA